jgi:aspartokinase/homoserine dehydrogenase 1
MGFQVFKFGGTSLASPESLQKVLGIIEKHQEGLCIVVSASSGVTDNLYKLYYGAVQNRRDEEAALLQQISERHRLLVHGLIPVGKEQERVWASVKTLLDEIGRICESLAILREQTAKTLSKTVAYGERLMALVVSEALKARGQKVERIDSTELIKLMREKNEYTPDDEASQKAVESRLKPVLRSGVMAVVPGFFGEGPEGEVMILGRGGSDYSATLIGSYLEADAVCLFKEVDGLMTADPRHVFEARVLPELHYREATELAYYGARVLHPRAIIPLVARKIPLIVKNTFLPDKPGTRIAGDVASGSYPVKALSYIDKQALVSVEGKGMMGVPGMAARVFGILAQENISICLITQASSEASICFVVPGEQGELARKLLESSFRYEIERHLVDEIKLTSNIAVLAIVGLGMNGTPGIAARAFSCIARQGINIIAIAQGSSELNISVVIEQHQAARALRALHHEYGLEKIRPVLIRDPSEINLAIFGLGQIGQVLVRQLQDQKDYLDQKLKLRVPIVGVADRSGLLTSDKGFSEAELEEFLQRKMLKQKLCADGQSASLEDLWHGAWDRKIFIDLTATETAPILKKALLSGFHVVLANKKPLAIPYKEYKELRDIAAERNLSLRYEATVGAGLPVLDTIDKLEVAGDEVLEVLGCLSGTLGYLMTQMEDGMSFSQAVRTAYELGYTEPDPRDDLSGMDVARKALILARTIGLTLDLSDIKLEGLYPQECSHDDPQVFLQNLTRLDQSYGERIRAAQGRSAVLRFVARISRDHVSVGIEELEKNSPFGRLRGTDNQVTLKTQRYMNNPLIVTGPGAGAEVTAAGVLNDIITIASSQERGGRA